ncbi:hypothetical protein ACFRAO_32730 [Streptomyces sp. NPDC056656]|uniref:hypothetical protein n=1 Tax=Streptomyces sp. NPDC056656 TaxID=3345895 RepID=UPI0036ADA643
MTLTLPRSRQQGATLLGPPDSQGRQRCRRRTLMSLLYKYNRIIGGPIDGFLVEVNRHAGQNRTR